MNYDYEMSRMNYSDHNNSQSYVQSEAMNSKERKKAKNCFLKFIANWSGSVRKFCMDIFPVQVRRLHITGIRKKHLMAHQVRRGLCWLHQQQSTNKAQDAPFKGHLDESLEK